jgi:hypothetical protein
MAFTVEDGSGLSGSNSYESVAGATAYHIEAGNAQWADIATDALREEALVRASRHIDRRFGRKFRGTKNQQAQAMQWPRSDAYDNDDFLISGLPVALLRATAEYAMKAFDLHSLTPDPPSPVNPQSLATGFVRATTATGQADRFREKIGPLEEETRYRDPATTIAASGNASRSSLVSDYNFPEYPSADLWIEELLRSSSTTTLVRG